MPFPAYAYRDHSFQAFGNSKVTRPLSLPAWSRLQHWNRPGQGVRQRIFRGCGWWSRQSLGGACDYFRRAPPRPGLRRPVLDTVSDLCSCALSLPLYVASLPVLTQSVGQDSPEGMALSGQGGRGLDISRSLDLPAYPLLGTYRLYSEPLSPGSGVPARSEGFSLDKHMV